MEGGCDISDGHPDVRSLSKMETALSAREANRTVIDQGRSLAIRLHVRGHAIFELSAIGQVLLGPDIVGLVFSKAILVMR